MRKDELRARLEKIDVSLDDERISCDEFDALQKEAQRITAEIGEIENRERFADVDEISNVSEWTKVFLNSFGLGTRKITNKQAQIFERVNHKKPFKFDGKRYDCNGANYRTGFSTIVVTKI